MNEVECTRETYEQISADYAATWTDRGVLQDAVKKFVALLPVGGLVLDVGCGPGFDTAVLQQQGLCAIGVDFAWAMMQTGREYGITADFVQADMRHLPFRQVDGVWACASLLHLPRADVAAALQGFHQTLKPGGALYLSVKQGEGETWMETSYGRSAKRFFTYWQPPQLDKMLEMAGFTILEGWDNETPAATWLTRLAQRS